MKSILLTGGTGTFGHAFIPAALQSGNYSRIAIYSRDEDKQFRMRRELGDDPRLRWFIGDVRDRDRLELAMRGDGTARGGIDCVVHAAALKHVPSGEYNPFEHVKTNVVGAQNIIDASMRMMVKKVIAVSTDKAVEPINLYGATKLCMERLFIASNAVAAGWTKFSCVRYGNVLGSRGSFLETLQALKAKGAKTYQLRSAESTRFWLQANDAAQFVLDRLEDMHGGEIFVPKIRSSLVADFAREILPDARPEIVGVPVGEKIHETLISEPESEFAIDCGAYYAITPHGVRNTSRQKWSMTSNV